jgi:anti-sigma factor RsiW
VSLSDETLMRYADGELADEDRLAVEQLMRRDPEIRQRVEQHLRLRQELQSAFSGELGEPVPPRLIAALRESPAATHSTVVQLRQRHPVRAWIKTVPWRMGGALAASLLIGLALGVGSWRSGSLLESGQAGGLLARGALATALSQQLSGQAHAEAAVVVGLSFRTKSGEYCRAFSLRARASVSGLACRSGMQWRIDLLHRSDTADSSQSDYRLAASESDPLLLSTIEKRIAGEPLDQAQERAARDQHWDPAPARTE